MKLIENVGQAARLWSVQVSALAGIASGWWLSLPSAEQAAYLAQFPNGPALALLVTAVAQALARMAKQTKIDEARESEIQRRIDAAVAQAMKNSGGGGGPDPTR